MKERTHDSSPRGELRADGVSSGMTEKSPGARGLSQTMRDPARRKRNASQKTRDRCNAPAKAGANGCGGESSSLNEAPNGAKANGKRNGREISGENAAASDDATGPTPAGDASSAAVCMGRDACAEVAANGFDASLRRQAAHEEESGTEMNRRPRPSDDLEDAEAKVKKEQPLAPQEIDDPLALDAPGFVDEMHARVNLYKIAQRLLQVDDLKVNQRTLEFLLDMKYGKGATVVVEEPQRIDLELPRPKQ